MPYVTDDTDVLESTSLSPKYDAAQSLPRVLPPSRRGGWRILTALRGWLTPARRQQALHTPPCLPHTRQFELPLDMLARKYPDLYLRLMNGSG